MRSKRLTCKKCGKGPFKNAQALGAHNRYAHPKFKTVKLGPIVDDKVRPPLPRKMSEAECKEQETLQGLRKRVEAVAENAICIGQLREENWFLRFLLRRGVRIDPDQGAGLHVRVQQQILPLEKELRAALDKLEDVVDNSTPF